MKHWLAAKHDAARPVGCRGRSHSLQWALQGEMHTRLSALPLQVCSDYFRGASATVACRQLGFLNGTGTYLFSPDGPKFGPGRLGGRGSRPPLPRAAWALCASMFAGLPAHKLVGLPVPIEATCTA